MTQTDRVTGFISDTAIKAPVRAATTAAITLAGEQTVDGVALVTDDRVLVKNQGSSVDNGIYVVDTGAWSRAPDFDGVYDIVRGTTVFVVEGSANGSQYWRVATAGIITIGTTGLSFERALVNDSSTIIFTQSGVGAVATTVQEVMRSLAITPDMFGAVGDGVTDDTAFVVLAIGRLPNNGVLIFTPGKNYKISSVSCNGKAMTLWCYGATITFTSASGAFSKTDHGFKLCVLGGTWVASGATSIAIKYNATPSTNTYDDYLIRDGDFTNGTNGYAVSLVGAREGNIQRCTFRGNATGGGAVYLQASVLPFIESTQFIGGAYAGTAVFYDGTGTGFDAGLVLQNCEIMGWDTGVDVRYCDWLKITGCTIDYNEVNGIVLYSQDGAIIEGNYLGSLNATPALQLSKGVLAAAPDYCAKIHVSGNHFTGHYTGGNTYDCILINDNDCENIEIINNHIHFYTRYGINFKTLANILIAGNSFSPRVTFGVLPIFNSTGVGDSRVAIRDNNFPSGTSFAGSGITFAILRDNLGYVTNTEGGYITSGAGTTYSIPHGMSVAPNNVQLASNAVGIRPLRVTGIDATNIDVATDAVYAAWTIYWTALKMRGI